MTIKNEIRKPMVTITRLGRQHNHMEDEVYEHLKTQLNVPLPVSTLGYQEDGRLCYVSVHLPKLRYKLDDGFAEACKSAMIFYDEDAELILSYVD